MRVTRRHGRVRMHLEPVEAQLLARLFDELDALLAADDADDPVLQRLNPAAYPDDTDAQAEYADLTSAGLRSERTERMAACRAELASCADSGAVELDDADSARRWIQVLNDLRLAVGTRIGITEEDHSEIDPTDAAAQPRIVYYWLTELQDSVVRGLMR